MRWFKNIYIQSRVIGAEHSKSWKIISSAHSRAWLTIKIFFTPLPTESSWAPCHQGGGSRMASFPKQACKKEDNRLNCWIKLNPFNATSSGFLTKKSQHLTPQDQVMEWLSWKTFIIYGIFITNSVSFLVIGLFRFSISSLFSLERFYVSRNLSISFSLSNLFACNCLYNLLWSFIFLWYWL